MPTILMPGIVFVLIIIIAIIAIPAFKIKNEEYKRTGKHPKGYYTNLGMAFGVALGLPLGAALDQPTIGIAIGLPIGLVFGMGLEKKYKKELRPLTEKEEKIQRKMIPIIVGLLIAGAITGFVVFMINKNINTTTISNFEECIAAGNPAMESYPRQCRHEDRTFTEVVAKKFISNEFGFSFEYPFRLGEASVIIFEPGKRPGGETGEKLAGSFSDFLGLEFGGVTDDFSAGRNGLITDTRGFIQKDGKYYFKFVSNKSDMEIQPYKVIKKDFGEILLLNDQSFEGERNGSDGPVFGVGSGRLAGLVNLNNKKFPGIVFYNWNLEEFSETEFAALLNSLEVAASSQTISMSQEEALEIAGNANECTTAGIPVNIATYNENSKTWWIDLERMPELEKDGCNPACVISEETKTAEVNWRCTGLIPDNEQ